MQHLRYLTIYIPESVISIVKRFSVAVCAYFLIIILHHYLFLVNLCRYMQPTSFLILAKGHSRDNEARTNAGNEI